MNAAAPLAATSSQFSRTTVLGMIVVGFVAFLAMLYFIGAGNTGDNQRPGVGHAASNAINGYSGLVKLLEGEGVRVRRSRSPGALTTPQLLILTPTTATDPEEFAQALEERAYVGPTLVILPKWNASAIPQARARQAGVETRDDWVLLDNPRALSWTASLPEPFAIKHRVTPPDEQREPGRWAGLGLAGDLPTGTNSYAEAEDIHEPLVIDRRGRTLALSVYGEPDSDYYENAYALVVVAEPDLMNNYAMADAERAGLALELIREANYDDIEAVTFDLTLAGLGQSVNLLTLAFQPPFLAATLCLIIALFIIGWRAFLRFGPSAVRTSAFAYGKSQLVENSAGLIVRARRARLLAEPYEKLSQRRIARLLGLHNAAPVEIDEALATRMPDEASFSKRAADLQKAKTSTDIVHATQALDDLTRKLST